jgi:uncharacterized protein (TIGR01319 family)
MDMSKYRVFIDFGSTFTKAVAFDVEQEELAARVQVPSTVDTDISVGLREAFDKLSEIVPIDESDIRRAVACSSAAGGLRMICIGLVPEYTTEAGRLAALGAGAKIVGTYSYEITRDEQAEIAMIAPDIVLLTGGTDGGNKKTIINNAKVLSEIQTGVKNIIVAGNKSARNEIEDIFSGSHKNVIYTKNVMPEFGKLNLDPVNEKIRELFISRITDAKGISQVREMIGEVVMPTPSAVLEAAKLIADGTHGEPGLGELLLVDVGGATTDVYSIAKGAPTKEGTSMAGLPEPYAKRTVEGDLGLFHNLDTLSDIAETVNMMYDESKADFEKKVTKLKEVLSVPEGADQKACQLMLSQLAVKTAVDRHVGTVELVVTHNGEFWVQRGKDMTQVKTVIGAGGPVAFSSDPKHVLEGAIFSPAAPYVLKPQEPKFLIDAKYILFAIGLLSQSDPAKALRIIKKYLVQI